jgi:hypothetical protein
VVNDHRTGTPAGPAVRKRRGAADRVASAAVAAAPGSPDTARRSAPLSRRTVLTGGVGASVLVALPDVMAAAPARADSITPSVHYFLYGSPGLASPPALRVSRPPAARSAAVPVPRTVGAGLAARPVRSADGATIAYSTVQPGASGAQVTLALVDTAGGAVEAEAALHLPGVPVDASVLVQPVFAATAAVALVIAVTVPTGRHAFSKITDTRAAVTTPTATWTTHHVLAYFDRGTRTFAGPFDLADAPALAWTDAVADAENLYVWTIREPALSVGTKAEPLPQPPVRLLTFPLGSGRPSRTVRSPGAWPSGTPALTLADGRIARVVEGRDLEVYAPRGTAPERIRFAELQIETAKAGVTNLHPRSDGTLVITNAAFGRAVVVDPAAGFRSVSVLDFPRPKTALGGPEAKSALSPDGSVLYTLGSAAVGGLNAYDLASGDLIAAFGGGEHYSGVYRLQSGTVLGVVGTETGSALGFFDARLGRLGAGNTDMYVAEVF